MKIRIALALLFLAVGHVCLAQGFYNKGATVSFAAQTIVVFPDSVVNTGTLINNGNVTIAGAWINEGTYVPGTGVINFDNSLTQVINHNDQSIANMTVSGGGVKQFLGDITIQSELNLQEGILESGNGAKIIMSPGSIITGGSDQAHVQGPVQRSGQGNWLFPIGNGSKFLPVQISDVSDVNAVGTVGMTEPPGGTVLSVESAIDHISAVRYWELTLSAGALGQSKIMLPMRDLDALTSNPDFLVVAQSSTATGPYATLGQSARSGNLASGTVTSEKVAVPGFYALATVGGEHPIEVFNFISPNGDTKNEFLEITNIEFYPNNRVTIFNRWGDKVFEMAGYDNVQKNFRGDSVSAGTYFYSIDLGDGSGIKKGFLELK